MRGGLFVVCAALCLVLIAAGCPEALDPGTRSDPVKLDLRLRLRTSCGFTTSDYDTQCLQALMLIVKTAAGDKLHCRVLSNPPDDIQSLVFESTPLLNFGELTTTGPVTFQVRGLHNKNPELADAGPAVCADYANFDNWLFFGEVAFDLSALQAPDAGDVQLDIPVDCRDCDMGCQQLGQPTCPINPISFCVPGSANLTCEKPCETGDQCFERALDCDGQRCDQASAGLAGFCRLCSTDDDCAGDGNVATFCVGLPGETTGLCAPRCPENRCPTGARCNRLGNRLSRIGYTGPQSTDGGT